MDIQKLLDWTDKQVLNKTGKHLDSLQKSILQGIWEHQDYEEIAQDNQRSYDHIKKEAWKLWQLLSDVFEEDIKKSNVRSILENKASSTIYHFVNYHGNNIGNNNINICRENPRSSEKNYNNLSIQNNDNNQLPIIDLKKAPQLKLNYGRNLELLTLQKWIENRTQLISIYGLTGIGKTAIALELIEQIKPQFDYIIYRSLDNLPPLSSLESDLKLLFSQHEITSLETILDYFFCCRCLLILDDVQNLFKVGELASQYLKEYRDYSKFFRQVATTEHQSCLILLSWEQPREFVTLKSDKIKSLYLKGLTTEAEAILKEYELKGDEKWTELIKIYHGHPQWLNIISSTIIELFDGDVLLFLEQMGSEIYLGDIEDLIKAKLERLSEAEKTVIYWLANQPEVLESSGTIPNIGLSQSQFWETIQSLMRRCLVDKLPSETSFYFKVNSVFESYLKT
jgi:hypothetical protein